MIRYTIKQLERALACEKFMKLTQDKSISLVGAARAAGKSPSFFSGANSVYARYRRMGMEAIAPKQSKIANRKS